MMTIERTISKEQIKELPKATYHGRIYVVQTEAEADKAVLFLKSQHLVGIDSETRPSFRKGQTHKVALLQVATEDSCFLFRLNVIGLTPSLVSFLEDPNVLKVGLSLRDDFMMLHKRGAFDVQGCVELQEYVRAFGIQDKSLQKIYALLFKQRISKSQQLTNWEADVLTDGQKHYAAIDAWACLSIYNLLQDLKETGSFVIAPPKETIE